MEVRSDNTIIKVDNASFVKTHVSRELLESIMMYIDCAIDTGEYKKMTNGLMLIMQAILREYGKEDKDTQW